MEDIVLKHTIVKRIFTIYQLAHFLIVDLEKEIKKFNSKLVIIRSNFFLSDPQIAKEEKKRLVISSNDQSNQKDYRFYNRYLFS